MPSSPLRRRQLLQAAGAASITIVTGCGGADRENRTPTAPPKGGPTTPAPATPAPNLSRDDFEFEVSVLRSFTEDHTAQLRITFGNNTNERLTVISSYDPALPFGDFTGQLRADSSDTTLLLVTEGVSWTIIDPDGAEWQPSETTPQSPTNGCWTLPFDPANYAQLAIQHERELGAGETINRDYGLYYTGECTSGVFDFGHSLSIQPPGTDREHEIQVGFSVTVSDSDVAVTPHERVLPNTTISS